MDGHTAVPLPSWPPGRAPRAVPEDDVLLELAEGAPGRREDSVVLSADRLLCQTEPLSVP